MREVSYRHEKCLIAEVHQGRRVATRGTSANRSDNPKEMVLSRFALTVRLSESLLV